MISAKGQVARIDVLEDLSKATLDIIGLAGMIHLSIPVPRSSTLARFQL